MSSGQERYRNFLFRSDLSHGVLYSHGIIIAFVSQTLANQIGKTLSAVIGHELYGIFFTRKNAFTHLIECLSLHSIHVVVLIGVVTLIEMLILDSLLGFTHQTVDGVGTDAFLGISEHI